MSLDQMFLVPGMDDAVGGPPLSSRPEVFELRYTVAGSPASDVKGRHTVSYNGGTTLDFIDYPSESDAQGLFGTIYAACVVAAINKGFRVTVSDPVGNLDEATILLSSMTDRPPNDNTGGPVSLSGQSDYVAPVSGTQEIVTIGGISDPDTATTDSNGNQVSYDAGSSSWSPSAGAGWTQTNGSGNSFQFTCNTSGPKNTTLSTGGGSVNVDIPGVDDVAETFGQAVVGFGGTVGWIEFQGAIIPLTEYNNDVAAAINAVLGGVVSSVTWAGSSQMFVNYSAPNTPGSPAVGGYTGSAVDVAIATIQDGAA